MMSTTHPNQRIVPGLKQESVWDYPKDPHAEACSRHIQVVFADQTIAESHTCLRVIQEGVPPVYYIPKKHVRLDVLKPSDHSSFCGLKGPATYYHIEVAERIARNAAWSYLSPPDDKTPSHHVAFYVHLLDQCLVDGVLARAPQWVWVGGWVTSDVVGPFITQKEAETWHKP